MDDNERALHAVLDNEADQDVPVPARRAAERDVSAIRQGMVLLATDAARTSPRQRFNPRWLAVAAGITVLAAALILVPGLTRDKEPAPSIGAAAPTLSLPERVAAAERIVLGTVTRVDRGNLDGQVGGEIGDGYVLATVSVEEVIKGPDGDVVTFSYDFGGAVITSEGSTRAWNVGDHILLFLLPDIDTVSASLTPPHMQVAEGEAGRYFVDGDRLVDAAFTLDDVRRAAGGD